MIVNTKPITESQEEKDLGVYIDTKLSFDQHITKQVSKANRIMGTIRRTMKNLNPKNFTKLYIPLWLGLTLSMQSPSGIPI
jgi:hypothetical protein